MGEVRDPSKGNRPRYVQVAVPVPVRRTFTYALPPQAPSPRPGSRHAVPFGSRRLPGIVLGPAEPDPHLAAKARPLGPPLDADPVFSEELLAFLQEAARYYFHPLGEVLETAAPPLSPSARRALRSGDVVRPRGTDPGDWLVHLTEDGASGGAPPSLGTRQRALLEHLRLHAPSTLRSLRSVVPSPRAVLRSLERRGLVRIEPLAPGSEPPSSPPPHPPALTAAQRFVFERLREALPPHVSAETSRQGNGFLLHGVTGSGKTEIYLRLVEEAVQRELGAIVLVPEIALTPQLAARFRARFGPMVALLHSGRTDRERRTAWTRLWHGEARIALGARSALFAPVRNLGVVIVDEEHDTSFKQEEGFRYHARDMAMLRAHRRGALYLLGSATPSIETYHLARSGRIRLLELPERPTPQPLPRVEIVDLRRQRAAPGAPALLSPLLQRALEGCLERREQAILFLNRRGFAPSLQCTACAAILQCPACSVALTEHRHAGRLRCHYCDHRSPIPNACPACGHVELRRLGLGTERLEEELRSLFPEARIGRLDRDTARARGTERTLEALREGKLDVLVGTQMVTKGHDVPGVTLVGVVLADQSLAFPDFRAAERTFQTLTQVAGRAGRGERAGQVLLQTFQPEHPAVRFASRHDYHGFFDTEVRARRELGYPPFGHLVAVRLDGPRLLDVARAAERLEGTLLDAPLVRSGEVEVLGPAPAPIERLRGRWRFRILLRAARRSPLRAVAGNLAHALETLRLGRDVRATVDVDPVQML